MTAIRVIAHLLKIAKMLIDMSALNVVSSGKLIDILPVLVQ
jgi:hypothetical protein